MAVWTPLGEVAVWTPPGEVMVVWVPENGQVAVWKKMPDSTRQNKMNNKHKILIVKKMDISY